jgi:tungstate transport system substrate-binding protein
MRTIPHIFLFLVLLTHLSCGNPIEIKLATTTSTENSGLLDAILPVFEKESGMDVGVISVGTGKALKLGKQGDVDVLLVHSREAEDAFVEAGYGIERRDVMYNSFMILGPPDDPAGIASAGGIKKVFEKLAAADVLFVSRGDDSGTHKKEKKLWEFAEVRPHPAGYKEAGQGMGAVIMMTDQLQGYTLSDSGTYYAMAQKIKLVPLFTNDSMLYNPYGVIAVNPERFPQVNAKGALLFIEWITGSEAQSLIGTYKKDGKTLFHPHANPNTYGN